MKKQNKGIKSSSLPFISGVEALSGQNIINEFRRHIHKTFIIGIVIQGKRVITHLEGSCEVSENEIFILNPGQVHSCSSVNQSAHSYKILSISPDTMQLIASQISEKHEKQPFFKEVLYKNKELANKLIQLFKIINHPESDIQIESNIYSFLSCLIISFSKTPPLVYSAGEQKESVKRVCNYIVKNYKKNLSLKKLAEIGCLSPFHFQREFKKNMGITPHEYLSDFRIGKSKELLLNTEDIADIAVQLGFFDQSHFSRIFKKTVGVPPGKYLKMNKINR